MTFLRHIAVRIWAAVIFWMLAAICLLPFLQAVIGISWLFIPALLLFGAVYILLGVVMDHIALAKLDRLLEEERIYERANMITETEKTLNAAVALFDSFFLSPKSRKAYHGKLLTRVAEYRLGRGDPQLALDRWVIAYLEHFPKDTEAARIWLQSAIKLDQIPSEHFLLITRLYQNQPDNIGLQHLLGRVFLAERRIDFEALQLYRRILNRNNYSDKIFLSHLAHLLAVEGVSDEWAFDIYLKAYDNQPDSPEILSGILDCVRKIGLHEGNRPLLLRARDLLSRSMGNHTDSVKIEQTLRTLQSTKTMSPYEYEETLIPTQASATQLFPGKQRQHPSKPFAEEVIRVVKRWKDRFITAFLVLLQKGKSAGLLRWTALVCICGGILFLVVNIVALLPDEEPIEEKEPHPKVIVEPEDPFTLQVAAYSSRDDAERYVQKLKQQNLNAYLTEAQRRDKKWYQVRISHFADHAEAKKYGEILKSKGIINDYYVANYKPPFAP